MYDIHLSQFFASDERMKAVRQMIMAPNKEQRQWALNLLLPYQRSDFEGIFRAMDGWFHHSNISLFLKEIASVFVARYTTYASFLLTHESKVLVAVQSSFL